jgi:hypothetical protein
MVSDPEGDLCRIEVDGVGGAKIEGLGFPDLFLLVGVGGAKLSW